MRAVSHVVDIIRALPLAFIAGCKSINQHNVQLNRYDTTSMPVRVDAPPDPRQPFGPISDQNRVAFR